MIYIELVKNSISKWKIILLKDKNKHKNQILIENYKEIIEKLLQMKQNM